MLLRPRQHLWRVHVLPPGGADINPANLVIRRHQSHSVGQAAVAILLRLFEIIEKLPWTDKKPRVDGIVILQIFSDGDDLVASHPDFHRVIQVENGIELPIDCQIELICRRFAQEKIDNRLLEEMVAHRQKKRRRHVIGGCEG